MRWVLVWIDWPLAGLLCFSPTGTKAVSQTNPPANMPASTELVRLKPHFPSAARKKNPNKVNSKHLVVNFLILVNYSKSRSRDRPTVVFWVTFFPLPALTQHSGPPLLLPPLSTSNPVISASCALILPNTCIFQGETSSWAPASHLWLLNSGGAVITVCATDAAQLPLPSSTSAF